MRRFLFTFSLFHLFTFFAFGDITPLEEVETAQKIVRRVELAEENSGNRKEAIGYLKEAVGEWKAISLKVKELDPDTLQFIKDAFREMGSAIQNGLTAEISASAERVELGFLRFFYLALLKEVDAIAENPASGFHGFTYYRALEEEVRIGNPQGHAAIVRALEGDRKKISYYDLQRDVLIAFANRAQDSIEALFKNWDTKKRARAWRVFLYIRPLKEDIVRRLNPAAWDYIRTKARLLVTATEHVDRTAADKTAKEIVQFLSDYGKVLVGS